MKKKVHGFFQTTRFFKSLAVSLALFLFSGSLSYGIGALLFLIFSFAFNDLVDAPKDAIGHPHRAIPSGKLTQRGSAIISAVLFVSGLGWMFYGTKEHLLSFVLVYLMSVYIPSF